MGLGEGRHVGCPVAPDYRRQQRLLLLLGPGQEDRDGIRGRDHGRQCPGQVAPAELLGRQDAGHGRVLPEPAVGLGDARLEDAQLPALVDQRRWELACLVGVVGGCSQIIGRVALCGVHEHALLIGRFE